MNLETKRFAHFKCSLNLQQIEFKKRVLRFKPPLSLVIVFSFELLVATILQWRFLVELLISSYSTLSLFI